MKEISNTCGGNESVNQSTLERYYDGFGCSKEEALDSAWDKLIAAVEKLRTHKCDGDCAKGEVCALLIDEDETDVVNIPIYRRVRIKSCSHRIGYRCRLQLNPLNTIETVCVCIAEEM